MKITILYENKRLLLSLNSSIRVKDLINELSKKLKIAANQKTSLLNPLENSCYEDSDLITIKENLELLLYTVPVLKKASNAKLPADNENLEDFIKICTEAKETLKPNKKSFKDYKGYYSYYDPSKNYRGKPEQDDDKFRLTTKINSLLSKMETLKDSEEIIKETKKVLNSVKASDNNEIEANKREKPYFANKYITSDKYDYKKSNRYYNNYAPSSYKPSSQSSTTKVEVCKANLENLLSMGFDEEKCKKALIISNNKIEHATELLLGGSDFELFDQVNNNNMNYQNDYYGGIDKYSPQLYESFFHPNDYTYNVTGKVNHSPNKVKTNNESTAILTESNKEIESQSKS